MGDLFDGLVVGPIPRSRSLTTEERVLQVARIVIAALIGALAALLQDGSLIDSIRAICGS